MRAHEDGLEKEHADDGKAGRAAAEGSPASLMRLQRSAGNQAVSSLVAGSKAAGPRARPLSVQRDDTQAAGTQSGQSGQDQSGQSGQDQSGQASECASPVMTVDPAGLGQTPAGGSDDGGSADGGSADGASTDQGQAGQSTQTAQTLPVQTLPVQTLPVQTLPVQTLPVQTLPVQTLPVQTLSVQRDGGGGSGGAGVAVPTVAWGDFADADEAQEFSAQSAWIFGFSGGFTVTKDSGNMWAKPSAKNDATNGPTLLRHEQYHFNMAGVMAKKATAAQGTRLTSQADFDKLMASTDKLSKQYDAETNHGLNAGPQSTWEGNIDSGSLTYP